MRPSPPCLPACLLVGLLGACGDDDTGMLLPDVESCLTYRGLGALDDSAPTFEQYKEIYAKRAPEGWVVEGDLLVEGEEELWLHYRRRFAVNPSAELSFRSLISCVSNNSSIYDGLDRIWNVHRKLNLTYCFGEFQNTELESKVRIAVENAIKAWERAADVNFILIDVPAAQCLCGFENPPADFCTERSYEAKIQIRQGRADECPTDPDGQPDCFLGQANYPSVPDFNPNNTDNFKRLVRIWEGALDSTLSVQSVVTHELGHVLGLAHEFSRYTHSDADCTQNAESAWRTVTDPDTLSVMGYTYCYNTFDGAIAPTSRDRLGLSYLYNLPRYTRTRLEDVLTDDIIWHRPGQAVYEVWQTTPNGSGPVDFTKEVFCYDPNSCTEVTPRRRAGPRATCSNDSRTSAPPSATSRWLVAKKPTPRACRSALRDVLRTAMRASRSGPIARKRMIACSVVLKDSLVKVGRNGHTWSSLGPVPLRQVRNRSRRGHARPGSRRGIARPFRAAVSASVRYSKARRPWRLQVCTTDRTRSTNRLPVGLSVPKEERRQTTGCRISRSARLFVGSTSGLETKVHIAGSSSRRFLHIPPTPSPS